MYKPVCDFSAAGGAGDAGDAGGADGACVFVGGADAGEDEAVGAEACRSRSLAARRRFSASSSFSGGGGTGSSMGANRSEKKPPTDGARP